MILNLPFLRELIYRGVFNMHDIHKILTQKIIYKNNLFKVHYLSFVK